MAGSTAPALASTQSTTQSTQSTLAMKGKKPAAPSTTASPPSPALSTVEQRIHAIVAKRSAAQKQTDSNPQNQLKSGATPTKAAAAAPEKPSDWISDHEPSHKSEKKIPALDALSPPLSPIPVLSRSHSNTSAGTTSSIVTAPQTEALVQSLRQATLDVVQTICHADEIFSKTAIGLVDGLEKRWDHLERALKNEGVVSDRSFEAINTTKEIAVQTVDGFSEPQITHHHPHSSQGAPHRPVWYGDESEVWDDQESDVDPRAFGIGVVDLERRRWEQSHKTTLLEIMGYWNDAEQRIREQDAAFELERRRWHFQESRLIGQVDLLSSRLDQMGALLTRLEDHQRRKGFHSDHYEDAEDESAEEVEIAGMDGQSNGYTRMEPSAARKQALLEAESRWLRPIPSSSSKPPVPQLNNLHRRRPIDEPASPASSNGSSRGREPVSHLRLEPSSPSPRRRVPAASQFSIVPTAAGSKYVSRTVTPSKSTATNVPTPPASGEKKIRNSDDVQSSGSSKRRDTSAKKRDGKQKHAAASKFGDVDPEHSFSSASSSSMHTESLLKQIHDIDEDIGRIQLDLQSLLGSK
ncbi:hypothetical protein BJ742DRAFT_453038 [Cladochytrium replicatum]|nr:hypothetical protein BJ742DRAFT_453038 [Cladochytrium replicatum]